MVYNWDALLEYRSLIEQEFNSKQGGFLIGVSRHITDNTKFGIGYNFTDFNDDLTSLNFKSSGWFFNVQADW